MGFHAMWKYSHSGIFPLSHRDPGLPRCVLEGRGAFTGGSRAMGAPLVAFLLCTTTDMMLHPAISSGQIHQGEAA